MSKVIFKGIGVDLIGTVMTIGIGFLVIPIYLRFLTADEYGLWLSIYALTMLIGAIDSGTDQYLIVTAANTESFENNKILDSIFLVFIIKIAILVCISIASYVVYKFLGSLIKFNPNLISTVSTLYLLAIFNLFIVTIGSSIPAILLARQHFSLVNTATSMFSIFSSIGTVFFLYSGFGIYSLPIAIVLFSFIQFIYLFLQLQKKYPNLHICIKPINVNLLKEVLRYSFSFHMVRCVYGIFRVQYIFIAMGAILGPAYVASFNITNLLPKALSSNSMKLVTPFFPSLAELFMQGDLEKVKNIFFRVNKVLIRISIFIIIMLYFFNHRFVALWVGNDLYSGDAVMDLILVYTLLYIPMGAFGIVVYASKKFGSWPFWLGVEILITVSLSLVFGPAYGAEGIVASFIIGAVISQAYLFFLVKKELGFSCKEYVNSIGSYFFWPNFLTLIGAIIFSIAFDVDDWSSLVAITGGLTFLQLFSREGIRFILSTESGLKRRVIWAFAF